MMDKTLERRKHPRKRVAVRSKIADATTSCECDTVDLSANGLSCFTERPLEVFTKVRITLMIPEDSSVNHSSDYLEPIECEGVVVRSERELENHKLGYHTAIFFNHIDGQTIDLIQQYVAAHKH